MPVVNGKRVVNLEPHRSAHVDLPSRRKNFCMRTDNGNQVSLTARGPTIDYVQRDLALVRTHFGLNISDSMRVALHLTAEAIRADKALPDVRR